MLRKQGLSWTITSLVIAAIVVLPLLSLLVIGFSDTTEIWSHLSSTVLDDYLINSTVLMLGVGLITLVLGVGSALLVTQFNFKGRGMFEWALLLPLAVPTYITAYSYTGLLEVAGPVQNTLRDTLNLTVGDYWFPEIRSIGGAIFVMSFVLYPYVYLLTRASFLEQSSSFRNVAVLMGHSSYSAFFRTTFAISRPAIVAGLSLVLMETLADFGAVSYFGLSTFTTGIFRTWYGLDSVAGAAQLSLLLLSFVIVLLFIEKASRKRSAYHNKSTSSDNKRTELKGLKAFSAISLLFIPIAIGFIIPMVPLFIWALESYATVFSSEFLRLVFNTVSLAAITALAALVLALLAAYANKLSNNPSTRFGKSTIGVGYAVPGTVIAVGTLVPLATIDNSIDTWFRTQFDISTGLILSGSVIALIIAYLVRFLAVALGSIDSGLNTISSNIDQSARLMGHSPLNVMGKIHIPILRSSLLTALLIVFVDVMKELPATLVLRPFNFNTLAVRAYELASDERLTDASLASLTIVLAGLVPVILLTKASLNIGRKYKT